MDEKIAKNIFDDYSDKDKLTKEKLKFILNLLELNLSDSELLKDIDKLGDNIDFKDFCKILQTHNKCVVTLFDIRNKLNGVFNKNIVDVILTKIYPNMKNTDEIDPTKILNVIPLVE